MYSWTGFTIYPRKPDREQGFDTVLIPIPAQLNFNLNLLHQMLHGIPSSKVHIVANFYMCEPNP